jgi:hypothetical protein
MSSPDRRIRSPGCSILQSDWDIVRGTCAQRQTTYLEVTSRSCRQASIGVGEDELRGRSIVAQVIVKAPATTCERELVVASTELCVDVAAISTSPRPPCTGEPRVPAWSP